MRKQVRVIRSANQTVVIYRDPPKVRAKAAAPKQRAVPVTYMGKVLYYIMPSGRKLPVREGFVWRLVKFMRPHAQFVAA